MRTSMTDGIIYSFVNLYKDDVPKGWYRLIKKSITSLKKHMDIPVCVVTNVSNIPDASTLFDHVIYIPFNKCPIHRRKRKGMDYHIFKWKYIMPNSPFDKTLHLDADTFIIDKFGEVFDMLDNFDMVTKMSVHYISKRFPDVPECFPELSGGYMAWNKVTAVDNFFKDVLDLVSQRSGGTDEPFIRKAMYHSNVRYTVIQNDYCINYGHPQYAFGKIKMVHGKYENIEDDAKIINHKVYEQFDPFKRLLYGNKLVCFKKKKQKKMFVKDIIPYHGNGWVVDVSEEERKKL